MTLAEILIFILIACALYVTMGPLQKRLESRLYKFFRSKSQGNERPVIDITDRSKKEKKR